MKILIVRLTPNKVDLNTYNLQEVGLAKALVRKGNECDIMYYGGKEKDHVEVVEFDDKLSFRILWLRGYNFFREGIYPSLKKYIPNYDVIQVGGYIGITSFVLEKKFPNKVVNYQGPYYCDKNKRDILRAKVMDNTLLKLMDKERMMVGTKSVLATEYVKSKGINNVRTIGVGLDLSNIVKENVDYNESDFISTLIKEKNKSKYVLYVGVLEERRNILFMIRTMRKIVDRYPDAKLVIVGKGRKEYIEKCMEQISSAGLEHNVLMCERIEQKYMKYIYECCDVFMLPTTYEIYGMVLLEAMYFGLPVFTTLNGGSSTMIDGSNGFIIDGFDEEEWAVKIVEVLRDEGIAKEIGAKASETIEKKYTWDALSENVLQLYMEKVEKG